MKIIQISPRDRRYIRAFIHFPFDLYQHTPQWVPPLWIDMRKIFKPAYPFYQYGDAAFLLAVDDDGKVVGRLAIANNHRYNAFHQTKTAFFYYFETIDDVQVAQNLFLHGYKWAQDQGLNHILGPKGLTVLDGFGLLVKGFEHQPAFGHPYNPPYYQSLIEHLGFTKVRDIYSGWIDRNTPVPEKILKAANLVEKRLGFTSPVLKTKAEIRSVISDIKTLYNDSLAVPSGNPPITDDEMDSMVGQLLWIADPKLVKLIYKGDKAVGFLMIYPEIGAALQRIKGRLFPLGWLQIILESKRTNWVNLNGIGIIEEYQRFGGTAVLYNEFHKSVLESDQYTYAELLQLREDNVNSLLEAANVEVNFHKTHRLYERTLE
jgi:hypothetical protein